MSLGAYMQQYVAIIGTPVAQKIISIGVKIVTYKQMHNAI